MVKQKLIRDAVATGKIKEDECNLVLERGISCPDAALVTELWETIKNEKHTDGAASKSEAHRPVALSEHGTVRQGAMGAWGTQQVNIPGTVTEDDFVEKIEPKKEEARAGPAMDSVEVISGGAKKKKE